MAKLLTLSSVMLAAPVMDPATKKPQQARVKHRGVDVIITPHLNTHYLANQVIDVDDEDIANELIERGIARPIDPVLDAVKDDDI